MQHKRVQVRKGSRGKKLFLFFANFLYGCLFFAKRMQLKINIFLRQNNLVPGINFFSQKIDICTVCFTVQVVQSSAMVVQHMRATCMMRNLKLLNSNIIHAA